MIALVIICLTLLFCQIFVSIMCLTDFYLIKDYMKLVRFYNSKNGRIVGLIFFNIVPLIPVIYVGIKYLIIIIVNNYPHIKDAINGEKE